MNTYKSTPIYYRRKVAVAITKQDLLVNLKDVM